MSDNFENAAAAPAQQQQAPAAPTDGATPAPTLTPAPKVKPIYFSRFSMRAPLTVGGQARPDIESVLMFGIYRENPRLVVKTNDPNDEQNSYGKITGAMDPATWGVFESYIEALVRNPVKDIKVIKNFNLYKGNQKFDEPQHINTTLVGREEDGRIYIQLVEEGRPSSKFYFGPPRFHVLLRMDKTEVSAGEASQQYALAAIKMLSRVMAASMGKRDDGEQDDVAARKPSNEPDGQRQGGWQGRQGGNGGWQGRGNGGGGWQGRGNGGGGWQGRGNGGGGWQGRGNGGGGWQGRGNGGGGGNWGNRQGGNGGGGGNYNGGGNSQPQVTNDEITF